MPQFDTLRLILGDQLNEKHSWFTETEPHVLYVIAELKQETDYVSHHVQKVCAFFLAMESFAKHLKTRGHEVTHLTLDETKDDSDLPNLIERLLKQHGANRFEYQQPDEYRLDAQLQTLTLPGVTVQKVSSEHFYIEHEQLGKYFTTAKSHQMEMFYRKMRKEQDVLMASGKPLFGKWNFDAANRNKLKTADLELIPAPLTFANDASKVITRLQKHQVQTIGHSSDNLVWPTNRAQSLSLLEYFCQHLLPRFGTFQDAMTSNSDHRWSLYHSRLSFALNAKMLSPQEVVAAAIETYQQNSNIDIAQIEGFVRQIIGWREFIRGIYWVNMPEYRTFNALHGKQNLPEFYWTGETKMHCMANAINQSLEYAYAHHIQRLMVTGTFSLLAGVDPEEVDNWYLGIYVDALEWVELPNTRGMSQFADGGIVATKPYAASGNYINKMSDYCSQCFYQVKDKMGEKACPFNSLYWHFMQRHRASLERNPRIGMVYKNWDKQSDDARQGVLKRAEWCLTNLNQL